MDTFGKVVLLEPGEKARITEMDLSLENMQKTVGGMIQEVYPYEDMVALVCNDEGKLMNLPLNRALMDENGDVYDIVAGTFFVCGLGEEDLQGLTDEQAEVYCKKFKHPQMFLFEHGKLLITESHDFVTEG